MVIKNLARICGVGFIDLFIFSRLPLVRRGVAFAWRTALEELRDSFDPAFYLRQIRPGPAKYADPFRDYHFRGSPAPTHEEPGTPNRARNEDGVAGHAAVLVFHHARGGGSTRFLTIFESDL